MSADQLESCRNKLECANQDLFKALLNRRALAQNIKERKSALKLSDYDPKREAKLFLSHENCLRQLSLKELWAFSLVMEAQAGECYPKWSEQEHLALNGDKENGFKIENKINPLLVLIFHPDKLNVDLLKKDFQFLSELASAALEERF
ncbi:MAG: hypothetical protein WEB87_04400 [Bacteriovoracaceae bacterium]